MKEQRAQLSYLNITPRKVRQVADTIRGLSAIEAEAQLMHRPQRAAEKLLKLLRSVVANATTNAKMNRERLIVSYIAVNPAPVLKRSLPRSMGRATPLLKRMSHVVIGVSESEKAPAVRFNIAAPSKKTEKRMKDKGVENKEAEKALKKETTGKAKPVEKDGVPDDKQKKVRDPGTIRRFFQRKSI